METKKTAEEILDKFVLSAGRYAHPAKLPSTLIYEAKEILRLSLGEEWIESVVSDTKRKVSLIVERHHPIGDLLSVYGINQIVELLELAVYLKNLYNLPKFDQVLKNLKESDYRTTLMQLALAHRLQFCGVEDLCFEPEVLKGRYADIAFIYLGRRYVLECYSPRPQESSEIEYQVAIKQISEVLKENPNKLQIAIRFKNNIDAKQRKKVVNSIISYLNEGAYAKAKTLEDSDFLATFEEISGKPDPDPLDISKFKGNPSMVLMTSFAGDTDQIALGLGNRGQGERHSRMMIWFPEGVHKDVNIPAEIERVTASIHRKLSRQTKVENKKVGRLISVEIPGVHLHSIDSEGERTKITTALKKLQKDIVEQHEGVSAILCVSRKFTGYRYRLGGSILLGKEDDVLPVKLLEDLYDFDAKEDPLG